MTITAIIINNMKPIPAILTTSSSIFKDFATDFFESDICSDADWESLSLETVWEADWLEELSLLWDDASSIALFELSTPDWLWPWEDPESGLEVVPLPSICSCLPVLFPLPVESLGFSCGFPGLTGVYGLVGTTGVGGT